MTNQGEEIRITVIATGFQQKRQRLGLEELELWSLVDGDELEILLSLEKRKTQLIKKAVCFRN